MVDYTAYELFDPEDILTLFQQTDVPNRLYNRLFGQPRTMGLYEFSMANIDEPWAMLPPVGDMEDAKEMMAGQGITNYVMKDYRGYVEISNRLINQWMNAQQMPDVLRNVKERFIMPLREAVENTIEYTCFNAMDAKRVILGTSHDWTAGATTADEVLEDVTKARKAYITATKRAPTVAVHNPEAIAQMLLRKDLSNMLYFPNNNALETGDFGRLLGMGHMEQFGGFLDFEGVDSLAMFQPSTPSKNLTYLLDPATFGYPVAFGAPKFTLEDIPSKEATRIYANFHAAFVYNKDRVDAITV